jgi:hypothetical protein
MDEKSAAREVAVRHRVIARSALADGEAIGIRPVSHQQTATDGEREYDDHRGRQCGAIAPPRLVVGIHTSIDVMRWPGVSGGDAQPSGRVAAGGACCGSTPSKRLLTDSPAWMRAMASANSAATERTCNCGQFAGVGTVSVVTT